MKILNFKNISHSKDITLIDLKPIDEIISEMNSFRTNKKPSKREFYSYSFGNKEECKSLFIEAFLKTDLTVKEFEYLSEYDKIIEWMTDTKGKGLALFGSVGRGKTNVLTYILPVIFIQHMRKVMSTKLATEIIKEEIIKSSWYISIDDIGTESIKNDFGTKTDVVIEAINHAEQYSKALFLTGNLTEKELIDRYGLRTLDRIKRLCKIVVFTGKSLRTWK